MYIETLPQTYDTEAEQKEIETIYMGGKSEARKRFQGTHSFSQHRSQSQDGRNRSLSRSRYDPKSRYNQDNRSRFNRFKSPGWGGESRYNQDNRSKYDRFKSPERGGELDWRDWLRSHSRPPYSPRCIGCKCDICYNNTKTLKEINNLIQNKLDVRMVSSDPPPAVTLCESVKEVQ